jgi:3-oxoacyl-[acyl-carrier protein] reductase
MRTVIASLLSNPQAQISFHFSGDSVYSMSKAALKELVALLSRDLGPTGTTVALVRPRHVRTDMVPNDQDDPMMKMLTRHTTLGRGPGPDEVANFVYSSQGPEPPM